MKLAELQHRAQDWLLERGELPAALRAAVQPPVDRWDVYADAYRVRLIEALAATYPALARHLGDAWTLTALRFVLDTPSTYRSVRDYGDGLADWLRAEVDGDPDGEIAADLAAFEWALAGAFDAADGTPLQVADLAAVPPEQWEGFRAVASPSVRRLQVDPRAVAAWQAAQEPAAPAERGGRPAPVEWLVWREGLECRFRSLEVDEAAALDALLAGETFATVCAALAERYGELAALRAAQWLRDWVESGLFARD